MRPTGDSIRVLHVDDDSDFADVAATFVEREGDGITVEIATSATEGLERLAGGDIDCVVSDYDMPGRDGIEFLERVRDEHPKLPFILYTGKGSEEVASDAISAGVTDYLQKETGTGQYAVLANRIENAVETHRTKTELAAREQRLNLFFEQSPLGVIEWNDRFEVVRLNDAAEGILGYAESDLAGRSWEVIVPECDRDAVGDVVSGLLEDKGGYHSVNENVRADGERIVCEWHNRVVTDSEDEVIAVFSQFQDITDRRKQKRRLERLIDNLPGMVYRCENERGWPMQDVGGEVEELTGYRPSELEDGERIYGSEIVHPDDRERVWETVQDALDGGEPFELTYRITTKGGATKWVWERGQGIGADDGGRALEGFVTDVMEREEIRRELDREREFVERALDTLDGVFYVLGPDGELRRWNSRLSEVTGRSDGELAGMGAVDLVPEEERSRIAAAIEETLRTGEASVESALLTADGDRVPYQFTGKRLTDGAGDVIGLTGIGRAVTEREEANGR